MFYIANKWLQLDAVGSGFEVATWLDKPQDKIRARVIVGPSGCDKHAWAKCYSDLSIEPAALDWQQRYKYNA